MCFLLFLNPTTNKTFILKLSGNAKQWITKDHWFTYITSTDRIRNYLSATTAFAFKNGTRQNNNNKKKLEKRTQPTESTRYYKTFEKRARKIYHWDSFIVITNGWFLLLLADFSQELQMLWVKSFKANWRSSYNEK